MRRCGRGRGRRHRDIPLRRRHGPDHDDLTRLAVSCLTRLAAAWHPCSPQYQVSRTWSMRRRSEHPHSPRRREPWLLARGLILCAIGFGLMAAPGARAQNASPPTSTLQVPPKQKATPAPAPTLPKAAPRQPVRQVGKPPPVVKPRGPTHAQKPPSKTKRAAPTAAAPAPAPAPAPPSPPAEPAKPAASDSKGSATSLPLPRFAALRSDEVNLRAGPGTRYPIEWVYKRRELPVQIQREFEVWRLVQDPDGIKGWVHQATLTGRRSFIVGAGDRRRCGGTHRTALPPWPS